MYCDPRKALSSPERTLQRVHYQQPLYCWVHGGTSTSQSRAFCVGNGRSHEQNDGYYYIKAFCQIAYKLLCVISDRLLGATNGFRCIHLLSRPSQQADANISESRMRRWWRWTPPPPPPPHTHTKKRQSLLHDILHFTAPKVVWSCLSIGVMYILVGVWTKRRGRIVWLSWILVKDRWRAKWESQHSLSGAGKNKRNNKSLHQCLFLCLLKAYGPANRTGSPQRFNKTCTLHKHKTYTHW